MALIVYQIGGVILGEVSFGIGTIVAAVLVIGVIYMLVRKGYQGEERSRRLTSVAAAAK